MIDRLKEIREKIFSTQLNMAKALNVSRQAVNEYERGNNIIPTKALIILINDYNININWLLSGQGNMLLSDTEKASTAQHIQELNDKIKELEIENKVLKELIKK